MSEYSKRKNRFSIETIKGERHNNNCAFPTLPDELWIPILIAALEPLFVLDEYCSSFNMERFYYITTYIASTHLAERASFAAQRMRGSLRLACRRFHNIMRSIPERKDHIWLRVVDNDPRRRQPPQIPWDLSFPLQWDSSCDPIDVTYGRLTVRFTFRQAQFASVICNNPMSTYQLFIRRENAGIDAFGYFSELNLLVPHHETLRVLHLGLEHCKPSSGLAASTYMTKTLFGRLKTLSLSFGANEAREILYLRLTLPHLRTLFLKFPQFDMEDRTLDGWSLPSLSIFSFHAVIGGYNVKPIPMIPRFLTRFLSKYGPNLAGLRLVPGLWGWYRSKSVQPMRAEDTLRFWEGIFNNLTSLSTDLRHLSEHFHQSTNSAARDSVRALFSHLSHLTHVGKGPLRSNFDGIEKALSLCGSKLESLTITGHEEGEEVFDQSWISWGKDSDLLQKLTEMCESASVKLVDIHGDPIRIRRGL